MPAAAATSSEFYVNMLSKGVSAFDAGRFDAAVEPLRIAAFGFVDSIEHYQTAQVYLALAHDRLGHADAALDAARRVVTAQRIDPRYGTLRLPPATRSAFETVAKKILTAADAAVLSATTVQTPPPATSAVVPPRTTTTGNSQKPATVTTTPKTEPVPVKSQPPPVKSEPVKTQPTPAPVKTEPAPIKTTPAPATTSTTTTTPKPAPPKPAPAQTTTTRPVINLPAQLTAAESALATARLAEARTIYRELLDHATLQRGDLLRVAEGMYRARDFAYALKAFERLGALRRGEEPYRYYVAVALYEVGQYARAKQELDAVLPFIEVTPDVGRYRTKIDGAQR